MTPDSGAFAKSSPTVSRRTLAKGAAWSLPVMAVSGTAPAIAASGEQCVTTCVNKTIDWDRSSTNYTRTGTFPDASTTGKYTLPVSGVKSGASSLVLDITTRYVGNMRSGVKGEAQTNRAYSDNLRPMQDAVWSFGNTALEFHQQARGNTTYNLSTGSYNDRGVYTFKFSERLCYLKFTIYDIDRFDCRSGSGYNDYADRVAMNATDTWRVTNKGSLITGTGTSTDPFRTDTVYAGLAGNDARGSVTIEFPNGVQQFSIDYWDGLPANYNGYPNTDGDQAIYISDLSAGMLVETCTPGTGPVVTPTPTPTGGCKVGTTYTVDWTTLNTTAKTVVAKATDGSTMTLGIGNSMGAYTAYTSNYTGSSSGLYLNQYSASRNTSQSPSDAQQINLTFGGATVNNVSTTVTGLTNTSSSYDVVSMVGLTGTSQTWAGVALNPANGTTQTGSSATNSMTALRLYYYDKYANYGYAHNATVQKISFTVKTCPS